MDVDEFVAIILEVSRIVEAGGGSSRIDSVPYFEYTLGLYRRF